MKSNIDGTIIQELLYLAKKDGIQKLVTGAVIMRNNKFLLLERALGEFMAGLVELPSGGVNAREEILDALTREVKEETGLKVIKIVSYLGFFDYSSSSGKKTRQFNFLVKTEPGDIKINSTEHCKYYLLNPSDKEFSKLNISDNIKNILSKVKK
ncbi:MAG: NUDIX hydrolase [Patescibacteria group bacterium]